MARNQIDVIDLVSLFALPLFAGVELGVWTLALNVFNFDFGATLFPLMGIDLTISMIGSLASISALVLQGHLDSGDFEREEWGVIVGALILLPLYALTPGTFGGFVDSNPIVAFVLWSGISIASVYISYKG